MQLVYTRLSMLRCIKNRAPLLDMKVKSAGISLIELVIFIIVVGIICTSTPLLMRAELAPQLIGSVASNSLQNADALNIANSRLQIILGQKALKGFNTDLTVFDLCNTPASSYCPNTDQDKFKVALSSNDITLIGNNTATQVTITVSGEGTAQVSGMIGNY
jgi:hypothetical protein